MRKDSRFNCNRSIVSKRKSKRIVSNGPISENYIKDESKPVQLLIINELQGVLSQTYKHLIIYNVSHAIVKRGHWRKPIILHHFLFP